MEQEKQSGPAAVAETLLGEPQSSDRLQYSAEMLRRSLDETEEQTLVGKVLGGLYRVEALVGEGGMGAVYAATHVHLKKRFALKVLAESAAVDRRAIERFLQEAQAASGIDNPHIIDVINFDRTADGRVFLVMELLEGQSLAQRLESGPVPPLEALALMKQLCDALTAAHEAGIVHRDLKPENVFLIDRDGKDFVKVLDFGISKVERAEAEAVRLTKTGQLVGTPLYMSPEQARGDDAIDHRADVYALGILLYEMLVGRPPFEGQNYFQLLWKHGNVVPEAPRASVDGPVPWPESLDAAILQALEKQPSNRYESVGAFAAALAQAASVSAVPASPPEQPGTFSRSVRLSGAAQTSEASGSVLPSEAAQPSEPAQPSAPVRPSEPAESELSSLSGASQTPRSRWLWSVAILAAAGLGLSAFVFSGGPTEASPSTNGSLPGVHAAGEPAPVDEARGAQTPSTNHEAATMMGERSPAEAEIPTAVEAPPPEGAPEETRVRFETVPSGAEVSLDGEVLCRTPCEESFGQGLHRLRLSRRGYRGQTVRVDPSEQTLVRRRLRPTEASEPSIRFRKRY